jgi:hypothetical protein
MFTLTAKFLTLLIELSRNPAWPAFVNEFKNVEQDIIDQALHFYPDANDFNAKERATLLRGAAIAVTVLANGFKDPLNLLEDLKLIEKTEQLKNEVPESSSY